MLLSSRRPRSARRGVTPRRPAWRSRWPVEARTLTFVVPKVGIALLVGVLLVLILNWGDPQLPYHAGSRVARDVIARVAFDVPDEEATRQQAEARRHAYPSIYRSDTSSLVQVGERLASAINLVDHSADLLAYQQTSGDLWSTLSAEEFSALKAVIARKGRDAVRAAGDEMLAEMGRRGVLDETRKSVEVAESRDRIIIQREPEGQVVALGDLLTPTSVRTWVAERATTIFGQPALPAAEALGEWASINVAPTLSFELTLTAQARQRAAATTPNVTVHYKEGQTLILRDAIIDEKKFVLLEAEQAAFLTWLRQADPSYRLKAASGYAVLVALLFIAWGVYFTRFARRVVEAEMRLMMLGLVALALVAATKVVVSAGWPTLVIPVAFIAILLTVAYDERFSLVVTGGLLVLVAVVAAAVLTSVEMRTRKKLMQVGGLVALVQLLTVGGLGLLTLPGQPLVRDGILAVANGLGSALVLSGVLPLLERPFGIATGISLLELADPTQPLLRELALRAPGTYNHSLVVATLAEEAAQNIAANSLLARVGGYYHDIGKMRKPEYFVENQVGEENKHGRLSPTLSTLIITAHTKDGAELAEDFRLPAPVREVIAQHHGDTVVEYFYKQAQRTPGLDAEPQEERFRYPGPKPQSKEAAIVMLADAVESASRTLREPSPGHIRDLVHDLVAKRLADGQLDDCSLTLAEVHRIEESLTKSLTAIYHSRISYV